MAVRQGRLPMDMGRILSTLSDLRNVGDYGGVAHVSHAEATVARFHPRAIACGRELFLRHAEVITPGFLVWAGARGEQSKELGWKPST